MSENTPNNRQRKLPKTAWKPGQSGNPGGRPKKEWTFGSIIQDMLGMSAEDIARMVGKDNDLGRAMMALPRGVQMKYLLVARVMSAIMFEPSVGLFNALMDRVDGKVAEQVELSNKQGQKFVVDIVNNDG